MQDFDGRNIRIARNLRRRIAKTDVFTDPLLPTHASA